MLSEEVVEVSWFIEAQAVADLGDVPVAMPEQGSGFSSEPVSNVVGGGFTRCIAYASVEVIDMYGKLVGKVTRRPKGKPPGWRLDRKLSFEEFNKDGRQSRSGIGVLMKNIGWPPFQGIVN